MTDSITIYHNPRCSKSRATLAMLRDAGHEPEVVLYLDEPPSAARLKQLLQAMGLSAREIMRPKEPPYKELGLADESLSEDVLIEHMVAHPILIERPIVVAGDEVRLCRPAERVQELIGAS
ncbi:MAG: arsenate reductase (glutaredoxin) [Hyphomicrobiaceae bacterium]